MSRLKVDNIEARSGNNISMDDPLALKSYSTTQRNALTSVAGDMIYNSTTSAPEFYDGTEWKVMKDYPALVVSYLIIGGGGGGGNSHGGGGGAGGYRNSYASETSGRNSSTETPLTLVRNTNYTTVIGSGGAILTSGVDTIFATVTSKGGSRGATTGGTDAESNKGSGGGADRNDTGGSAGTTGQGSDGGSGRNANLNAGGGGGAGAAGGSAGGSTGGNGGNGLSSSITGSAVTRAGGGSGGAWNDAGSTQGNGGSGGGGRSGTGPGTVNTGSGGGGNTNGNGVATAGGSGVVILRYPNDFTLSQSGLTLTTATVGDDKVSIITAGTGTVSFS